MRKRASFLAAAGLLGILAVGLLGAGAGQGQPPPGQAQAGEDKQRDADREAIRKAAREFADAFAKGDAKALASHWTPQGEYEDDEGVVLRGRADIEKAFSELFKEKPGSRIDIQILSIRFPSRDTAIEQGFVRQSHDGADLPISTAYSAFHVREDGRWKVAVCQEWGAGVDRLHDLDWLRGSWKGSVKDQEVLVSFERDKDKPLITGRFTKKVGGKVVASGDLRIGLDPQSGQLRSWHFDDDGGHGQAVWIRDGRSWVQDSAGVSADGASTASVNILRRVSKDEFTWRSVERVVEDQALPDTAPIKLTRVTPAK